MPSPSHVTDHVETALSRVTSRYQKPKILGITEAITRPKQGVEDALWTLLQAMDLETATGDLLTKIGKLVGELRAGRSDDELRVSVRLRIRVNRSRGRAVDIIDIGRLAAVNGTTPHYGETYPAGWTLDVEDLPGGNEVGRLLSDAKAAGTRGVLTFTPDADTYLLWGDDNDGSPPDINLWPDDNTSLPGNLWATAVEV